MNTLLKYIIRRFDKTVRLSVLSMLLCYTALTVRHCTAIVHYFNVNLSSLTLFLFSLSLSLNRSRFFLPPSIYAPHTGAQEVVPE